jgi:hypothetical protein
MTEPKGGWKSAAAARSRLFAQLAIRGARARAIKHGQATKILLPGRKLAPDAAAAIDKFMQEHGYAAR